MECQLTLGGLEWIVKFDWLNRNETQALGHLVEAARFNWLTEDNKLQEIQDAKTKLKEKFSFKSNLPSGSEVKGLILQVQD